MIPMSIGFLLIPSCLAILPVYFCINEWCGPVPELLILISIVRLPVMLQHALTHIVVSPHMVTSLTSKYSGCGQNWCHMFFVSILEQTIVQSRLECVIVCYLFFVFVLKTHIIAKHVYPKLKQKLTWLNRFGWTCSVLVCSYVYTSKMTRQWINYKRFVNNIWYSYIGL